jgi:hypothetical protein
MAYFALLLEANEFAQLVSERHGGVDEVDTEVNAAA